MQSTKKVSDIENGLKDLDVKPKQRNDLPQREKSIYMDEALSKTNFGTFNYVVTLVAGLISTAVTLETCGIAYVIPVSECDLRMSAGEKGLLSAVSFIGIICSSHFWGYLADTKGRYNVITPTLFVAFLLSCASSLVDNFYIFVALRFLNGFFISGSSATIFVYLSEFHDNSSRTRAIACSAALYGVSLVLVPLMAWFVLNQDWQFVVPFINTTYKPWRLFIVACSLPGFISFLMLLFLPETPKFVFSQGDKQKAYEILQKMHRWNNGGNSELERFEILEEPDSIAYRQRALKCKESRFPLLKSIYIQTAPLFQRKHLFTTVLLCVIQFGVSATAMGFYIFVVDILNKMANNLENFTDPRIAMCDVINMKPTNLTDGASEVCITKIAMSTIEQEICLELVFATGSILITLLINRLGKFPILFTVLIVCGAGGPICMLTDIPLLQIIAFLTLVSCGFATTIVNAATCDFYPTASRAMALCISLMFGRLGCVAGANTAALLLENHCETVFYISGFTVLAIGILSIFIPHIHEKQTCAEGVIFVVVPPAGD